MAKQISKPANLPSKTNNPSGPGRSNYPPKTPPPPAKGTPPPKKK